MRRLLFKIICAMLTFVIGLATARIAETLRQWTRPKPFSEVSNPPQAPTPLRRRTWPEPRLLDLELSDSKRLAYNGYLAQRLHTDTWENEASYCLLTRGGSVEMTFGTGDLYGMGNFLQFGLVSLLGTNTKQLLVSESMWRNGEHWVVSLDQPARIIFHTREWGLSRDSIRALDIDQDGVDEIVEEVNAFYDFQDKLAISLIPLPTAIFKYDAKARKYFPANRLHRDYLLRDNPNARTVSKPAADNFNHLADVLRTTLDLIYAGDEKEAWALFDSAYQLLDKDEIRSRLKADLSSEPVYQFIYGPSRELSSTPKIVLPAELVEALNRRFPDWSYLPVDNEIERFLKESISPNARPDLISGDFDGNGSADYAALIQARQSAHLVVFLTTRGGFKMHTLEPDGDYLTTMKKGEWDYSYETDSHFTYPHDAIFAGIFEKGGTSYVYEKGTFRAIITSD